MRILQSRSFDIKVKRFSKREKEQIDKQIQKIVDKHSFGPEKKGDLRGICVHEFKLQTTQYLLGYRFVGRSLRLIMIGPHENYYRDSRSHLKRR